MTHLETFKGRLQTFSSLIIGDNLKKSLAQRGFFKLKNEDMVTCFYCKLCISLKLDNFWEIHNQESPECNRLLNSENYSVEKARDEIVPKVKPKKSSTKQQRSLLLPLSKPNSTSEQTTKVEVTNNYSTMQQEPTYLNLSSLYPLSTSETLDPSTPSDLSLLFSDLPSEITDFVLNEQPNSSAHGNFVNKWVRQNSFDLWPPSLPMSALSLADAGFFYTQRNDEVTCFCCGKSINQWLLNDDPWIKHAVGSPHCPYIRFKKGTDFIKKAKELHQNRQQNFINATSQISCIPPKKCIICGNDSASFALIPCGHLTTCENCTYASTHCPQCGLKIASVLHIQIGNEYNMIN